MIKSGLRSKSRNELSSFVRSNYENAAVVVAYRITSEYNDEGYDNHIASARVLDRNGNVLRSNGDEYEAEQNLLRFKPKTAVGSGDYESDLSGELYVLVGE